MRKILIYGLSGTYGGVEAFVLNNIKHFSEEEYEFEFIVIGEYPKYLKTCLQKNVKVHILPDRVKHWGSYHRMTDRLVKSGNYDIIWGNYCTLTDIAALKAGTKYNVPVRIAHSHNSRNMGGKLVMVTHMLHKKYITKYATHLFACSDLAGKFMFGKGVMNSKVFHLYPNAIDVQKYVFDEEKRNNIRKQFHIEDKKVIGHVGRFHFQKNHHFLLEIFAEYKKKNPQSVLLLIGEGSLMDSVKKQATDLGLLSDVLFLGARNDVCELMQAMDLFLLPSVFEGLPIVAVEAQAAGLPCVLADTITRQVAITDMVVFESLEAPKKEWVRKMDEAMEKGRRDQSEKVKGAGYDIHNAETMFLNYVYNT